MAVREVAMSGFGRLYAAGYDHFTKRLDAKGGAEHRQRLVAKAEGEVLEIGAGTGRNLRDYPAATKVTALEPDPDMRARAERRARRARVPVEVVDGDALSLPFPDASFDTVVFSLVLCTIPDPARALREAQRVLRPGGSLRFYEHVRSGEEQLARRQDRWCRAWRWFGRGCHPNRDTVSLIEQSGFTVGELDEFSLAGAPSIVRPHVLGVAERVTNAA